MSFRLSFSLSHFSFLPSFILHDPFSFSRLSLVAFVFLIVYLIDLPCQVQARTTIDLRVGKGAGTVLTAILQCRSPPATQSPPRSCPPPLLSPHPRSSSTSPLSHTCIPQRRHQQPAGMQMGEEMGPSSSALLPLWPFLQVPFLPSSVASPRSVSDSDVVMDRTGQRLPPAPDQDQSRDQSLGGACEGRQATSTKASQPSPSWDLKSSKQRAGLRRIFAPSRAAKCKTTIKHWYFSCFSFSGS